MRKRRKARNPVADALRDAVLGTARIARDSNLSSNTLWSWRQGRRRPSGEALWKLAEGLERHAARLHEIASHLREAA